MNEINTKGRLLFLEHYLLDNTDEEHSVTAEQLLKAYEDNGYKANRSTIRNVTYPFCKPSALML